MPRRRYVVAVGARTLDTANLSMRKAFAISGLTFRLGALTFQDSSPEVSGLDFEQVVDSVVDFVDACVLTVIELTSSRT